MSVSGGELTIRGIAQRPDTEGVLPAVIISHGYTANHTSVLRYVQQFAEWGYYAFCFDFCGGCIVGMSDGATTDMSVATEKEDLKAVISYVQSLPAVDSNRILLMGCSQGGFVSGTTAAELGDQIQALIMFYPALCIPDDARSGNMGGTTFDPNNIPDPIEGAPILLGRCYPDAVMDMDIFSVLPAYKGPVFLAHGTKDEIVHYTYSERALAAYTGGKEAGPERQLLLIEGAAHGFTPEYDEIAVAAVKDFLRANALEAD